MRAALAELPFGKVGDITFARQMNTNPPLEGPSKSTRKLLSTAKALPSTSPVSSRTSGVDIAATLEAGNKLVSQLDQVFADSPVRTSATGQAMPVRRSSTGLAIPERSPGTGIAASPDSYVEARDMSAARAAAVPVARLPGIGVTEYAPFPEQRTGPMGMPVSGKSIAAAALGAAALYGLSRLLAGRKSDEKPARTNGDKKGPIVSRKPISKFAPARGAYKKGGVVKKRSVKKGAVRQTIKKMARKR